MKYSNFNLYIVRETRYFVDFSFGREDIGHFYVESHYFDTIKSLLKEFSHWSEEAIEEDVFTVSDNANANALKRTKQKVGKIKAKLKTEEDFKKFKEVYPNYEVI